MAPTLEDLQSEIRKATDGIHTNMTAMQAALADQRKELDAMKSVGARPETPPDIAKRIDDLDKAIENGNRTCSELQKAITDGLAASTTFGADLQKRLDELEKAGQRPGSGGTGEAWKSAGQQLVDLCTADATKGVFGEFAAKRARSGALPMVTLKSFAGQPAFDGMPQGQIEEVLKALSSNMTTGVNPASNFVPVMQIPGYIPMQRRRLRMRDVIPIVPTDKPVVRYLRQTGFTTVGTVSITGITRSGSTVTVTVTGHGYQDFDLFKVAGAVETDYNGLWRIKVVDANTFTFNIGAATPTSPATGTLVGKRMNNWGAATFVSEGGLKPEAEMSFEEKTMQVEVLAHYIKAHRQVLDDLPGLRANVDNDLLYGLLFREDAALLYGTGVSPQIPGIMLDPGCQTYKWSQGKVNDTKADALRRARTLVELALYEASAAVIHPVVWEEIELEKGSDGHYLWVQGPAGLNPAGESMWRVPLVVSPAIRYDQFLTGAFGAAATMYDREEANIRFSDQNEDDFLRNRVAILAEERVGVAWKRPEAFVQGSYDSAPVP